MWLEYIGPKYPGGIVEDYEHQKFYWGPENDWTCEVPDILGGMILEVKGVDKFKPCLPPVLKTGPGPDAKEETPKPKKTRKKK